MFSESIAVVLTVLSAATPLSASPLEADTFTQGKTHYRAKRYAEAATNFRRCATSQKRGCDCRWFLALTLDAAGHVDDAEAAFRKVQKTCAPLNKSREKRIQARLGRIAPLTPKNLPACAVPVVPMVPPPEVGEEFRYHVDINGLSVGIVDFWTERIGNRQGAEVIEYRSGFRLDHLVASVIKLHGKAGSLISAASGRTVEAFSRFEVTKKKVHEDLAFFDGGKRVDIQHRVNTELRPKRFRFPEGSVDFLQAFYGLQNWPVAKSGCQVVVGNARAYTIWLDSAGPEDLETAGGRKKTERFAVRYAHNKRPRIVTGMLWLSFGPRRIAYRAEISDKNTLVARLHRFGTNQ